MVVYDETNLEVVMKASVTGQDDLITYSQALLGDARRLIDSGQFSMAVVVSHIACEIAMERFLFKAFASKGIQYLEKWMSNALNGYQPTNDKIKELFTVLTGEKIQDQDFWMKFKNSWQCRKQFVHGGVQVEEIDAEDSLKACTALVDYLKR